MSSFNKMFKHVGWSVGSFCPFSCPHCYSKAVRLHGSNLSAAVVDRIVQQLASIGVQSVTLGGNEPLFTHGPSVGKSLLPYIIDELDRACIRTALVSSGPSVIGLFEKFERQLRMLHHVSVSLDSADARAHNENRKAHIFSVAIKALRICHQLDIPRTILYCGMNWNFDRDSLADLIGLARQWKAFVRVNPVKVNSPAIRKFDMSVEQYIDGFKFLLRQCKTIILSEPPLAVATKGAEEKPCACGITSFRINPIKPDGRVTVSPCMYLHDIDCGDLTCDDLTDIIEGAPAFHFFRNRSKYFCGDQANKLIPEPSYGGCVARAIYDQHAETIGDMIHPIDPILAGLNGKRDFLETEFASFPSMDYFDHYLCTWVGKPR